MTAGGWFSASELAAFKLPGLSAAKRKLNELAVAERWADRCGADGKPLARLRQARGGGAEYHVSLLPPAARMELAKRKLIEVEAEPASNVTRLPATGSAQLWNWFETQPSTVKAEAEERAAAIDAVEQLGRQ